MTREEKLKEIDKQWQLIKSFPLPIKKPPKQYNKGG